MGEKIMMVGSDPQVHETLAGLIKKSEENAREALDKLSNAIVEKHGGSVKLEMVPNEPPKWEFEERGMLIETTEPDRALVKSEERVYLFCEKDDRCQKISVKLCLHKHEKENANVPGREGLAACRYYSVDENNQPACDCPPSMVYMATMNKASKEELKQIRREQVATEKSDKKARAARKVIEKEEQE